MDILLKKVVVLVEELKVECPGIKKGFSKIKKTLSGYSNNREKKLSELLVIDICDAADNQQINKTLFAYIGKSLNDRYRQESVSRVRKLLKDIFFHHSGEKKADFTPINEVPDFLKKILPAFSRQIPQRQQKKFSRESWKTNPEYRLSLPLTEVGQHLLTSILEVINENKILSLESLFIENYSKIREKLKESTPLKKLLTMLSTNTYLRRELGFNVNKTIIKIPFQDLPPRLRQQCETFSEKALTGLSNNPELTRLAAIKGISVKKLKEATIKNYIDTIQGMLGKYKFDDYANLEVRSFLKIDIKKIVDETGDEINCLYNPLIDQIREDVRNKVTFAKQAGYDSVGFIRFLTALKTVAAFNGIFSYHKDFNLAYQINPDNNSKNRRKQEKKRVFDLAWIDSEIQRLYIEFEKIIKTKSFMRDPDGRSNEVAEKNLRKCLFFVMLVMLRHLGVRQQLIRNCKVGENIIFERDDSIRFYWGYESNKNDVEIYGHLDPIEHKRTHKIMIDTLNLYHKHIYEYTKKISKNGLNNQLLCRLTIDGSCERLDSDDGRNFTEIFYKWSIMFLEFGNRKVAHSIGILPHFFRGVCVDWLHFNLNVSSRNSAGYIGDTEATLKDHYLGKKSSFNLNDALDEANNNLRAKEQQIEAQTNNTLVKLLEKFMKREKELEKENQELRNRLPVEKPDKFQPRQRNL